MGMQSKWRLFALTCLAFTTASGAVAQPQSLKFQRGFPPKSRAEIERALQYEPAFRRYGPDMLIGSVDINDDGKPDFIVKLGDPKTCQSSRCELRALISYRGVSFDGRKFQQGLLPSGSVIKVLPPRRNLVESVQDINVDGVTYAWTGKSFSRR